MEQGVPLLLFRCTGTTQRAREARNVCDISVTYNGAEFQCGALTETYLQWICTCKIPTCGA